MKTGLLPLVLSPTTVTFQPASELPGESMTPKLDIVAFLVCAWALRMTDPSEGRAGEGLKPKASPTMMVFVFERFWPAAPPVPVAVKVTL